ncbi:MAG: molybdopterin-dependent oxidoreductase [Bacteroidales bacterium]|nr:molybdopterin-dependent oxidoreductase [Bacteroidales bacterium]MBN2747863.1 molybdopterin-dependent oxidoreductase [Bacteroidales bacterium]
MEIYNTACPRNCYSTCSFKVVVDGGKVINVKPNPNNAATPEGVCLKGISYVERANSPDRILFPHKRNPDGSFSRISWDEAYSIITQKLIHFRKEYGAQSVLFYAASGMSGLLNEISGRFWRKIYGGATTVYGNLCWPAGLEATRLTLGENKHNVPWDLENAKLIVLWGKNSSESNIQEMIPIGKAVDNGAKLIVVDPRRTDSSQRAHLLIQPKPSTDGALALAVAHLLIKNGWVDTDFIAQNVSGYEQFASSVKDCNPQWASAICDVPVDFIHKLAEAIGTIKPMTLIPGYGMQRYSNGGQTTRCLLALSVLTGNIGKPGACWHYANLQSYVFDDVLEPLCYYPPSTPDGIIRRSIATARLGADMLAQDNPPLKMVWVERGNPITQNPNTSKVLEAFRKLEFRVVVEQFFTDTALEADIVLPAKNMFEQTDIIGSYWNPYVQLVQKVVEPAGEVKTEVTIYHRLAQDLGFTKEQADQVLIPPTDQGVTDFLNGKLSAFPQLSLEQLKQGPVLAPGLEEIAFTDGVFRTPSGKIELYSQQAADSWGVNPLPSYDVGVDATEGSNAYPLYLMSPNTKNRIHSQFGNLSVVKMVAGEPVALINPDDARERGIANGDRVRVYNSRGEVVVTADVTFANRKGCVTIPNGWWRTQGCSVNLLSEGRETDMGHGTAFHDNKVEVEKLNGKA